jgi:hypothetical protein
MAADKNFETSANLLDRVVKERKSATLDGIARSWLVAGFISEMLKRMKDEPLHRDVEV